MIDAYLSAPGALPASARRDLLSGAPAGSVAPPGAGGDETLWLELEVGRALAAGLARFRAGLAALDEAQR